MKKLILLLLFIPLVFSCNSENDISYSIKVSNPTANQLNFTQLSLPGYNFNIDSDEQTFTLNNGMPDGLNNINVTISYNCMSKDSSKSIQVNFYEGQTTIIEVTNVIHTSNGCTVSLTPFYN